MAIYGEIEDLINIGAYVRGSNPECDVAIDFKPRIDAILQQSSSDTSPFDATVKALTNVAVEAGHALLQRRPPAASGR